jgi:dCTP deaminase
LILSDDEIRDALTSGDIVVDPNPMADQYTTSAVDLFLGDQFSRWDYDRLGVKGVQTVLDLSEQEFARTAKAYLIDCAREPDGSLIVPPEGFVIGITRERVLLRKTARIAARVEGRSSLARIGVLVHLTAPTIHAGFEGNIALEIKNLSPFTLKLVPYRTRICQLIFERLGKEPAGPIATDFQGQALPSGKPLRTSEP